MFRLRHKWLGSDVAVMRCGLLVECLGRSVCLRRERADVARRWGYEQDPVTVSTHDGGFDFDRVITEGQLHHRQ